MIKRIECIIKELKLIYYLNFKRSKLKESLANRKSSENADYCISCNECCGNCEALDKKTGLCKIWEHTDYRCKEFPMIKDQLSVCKGKCRYYW